MASTGRYGLEIRAANAGDAPGLAELLASADVPITPAVLAERLEALRLQPGVVLIAGEWGPPGGLAAVQWRRTLASSVPIARIEHLLVAPGERRRGLGRLLLKAASQAARTAGCAVMEIGAPHDAPALSAFCEATGFTRSGGDYVRPLRKGSAREPRDQG